MHIYSQYNDRTRPASGRYRALFARLVRFETFSVSIGLGWHEMDSLGEQRNGRLHTGHYLVAPRHM